VCIAINSVSLTVPSTHETTPIVDSVYAVQKTSTCSGGGRAASQDPVAEGKASGQLPAATRPANCDSSTANKPFVGPAAKAPVVLLPESAASASPALQTPQSQPTAKPQSSQAAMPALTGLPVQEAAAAATPTTKPAKDPTVAHITTPSATGTAAVEPDPDAGGHVSIG
jgi:hypothetical protein